MSNTERLAKNTAFMFFRMLITTAIGLFAIREVLRILGVEDYGIYNLVCTIVIMFDFLQQALNNAISRYITYDLGTQQSERLRQTFSMSFYIEVALTVVLVIAAEIVGLWFIENKMNIAEIRRPDAVVVFQFALVSVVFKSLKNPYNSMIIAQERMGFYAYMSIIEALLSLATVYFLLIINTDKLILYSILQTGVTAVILASYILFCRRNFKETRLIRFWDKELSKKLTTYSGWSIIVNIVDMAVAQATSIFFNIFGGVIANASLAIANQVNSRTWMFLNTFSSSYYPQIIKSYAAREYAYFHKLIVSTSKISFLILFGILFPAILNIDSLLDLWLVNPPKYAASFTYFIALFSLFDSYSAPLWQAVFATGNLRKHQILMSSVKIMNIPLSYIFLKLGAPLVSVLAIYASLNFIGSMVRIVYMRSLINLDLRNYFRNVFSPIIIVIALSIPLPLYMRLCMGISVPTLFVTSGMFLIIYTGTIYIYGLSINERKTLNGFIVQGLSKYAPNNKSNVA